MNRRVVAALLRKELLDVSRNRGALLPVVLVTALALIVPFIVTIVVPAVIGERLSDDSDLVRLSLIVDPGRVLSPDGRVQLFFFQQFLLLFLLTPTTGAMAMAAHSVVGEKLARTLEPLLATPVATSELLLAKVFGALMPTLLIAMAGLSLYLAGIAIWAMPGVLAAMANLRTAVLVVLVGPASALLSLQAAILDLVPRERCAHRAAIRRLRRHPGQRAARRPVHGGVVGVRRRPGRHQCGHPAHLGDSRRCQRPGVRSRNHPDEVEMTTSPTHLFH